MRNRIRIAGVWLFLGIGAAVNAQAPDTVKKEATVTKNAVGTFEVKLTPQPLADTSGGAKFVRMSGDKKFSGDLEATGKGEMLAVGTGAPGSSGGYVAIEWVNGTLNGKKGSFILQHSGTMTRGTQHMVITVVPESGTDELKGLSGRMTINIADGKHSYLFEYTLPQ